MPESAFGVLAGFAGWIALSLALDYAIRLCKYPKGYRVTSEYPDATIAPETADGTPLRGDS